MAVLGLLLGVAAAAPGHAEPYAAFAERMLSSLPQGVTLRPDLEDEVLASANAYRSQKRAKPLAKVTDGELLTAARAHALDLLQQNAMGHRASTGHDFESRMRSLSPGEMFMSRMAENAARERSKGPADKAKAQRLFQQWVKSASHRKTLVSRNYSRVATGVVQKGDVIYAVQIFAGPDVKTNLFQSGGGTKTEQGGGFY